MKLFAGLGNPGNRYEKTRHNVGFLFVEKLQEDLGFPSWSESKKAMALYSSSILEGEKIELLKPQTFMNDSGIAVKYARDKHKIKSENIFIVFDDLDISLGEYKIQKGKGPKDHNGLLSVYEKLGTKDFWHVRIGVENRRMGVNNGERRIPGEDYVLMNFGEEEYSQINKVVENVCSELLQEYLLR